MAKRRRKSKSFWQVDTITPKLVEVQTKMADAVFEVVEDTSDRILAIAIRTTPVDTGAMKKRWRRRLNRRGVWAKVFNRIKYAVFVEHDIDILDSALEKEDPRFRRELAAGIQEVFDA